MRTFTAEEVTRLTLIPATQIDYFVRTQVITPAEPASRRGVSRKYNSANVCEIAIAGALMRTGVEILDINDALQEVREHWATICNPRTRGKVAVLVVWESLTNFGKKTKQLSAQLGAADMLELATAGQLIHSVVPIGWIVKQFEDTTGDRLA